MAKYKRKSELPAALRSSTTYNGQLITTKELIDILILEKGYVNKEVLPRKVRDAYRLSNAEGKKQTFTTKGEKEYIDKLLNLVKKGAKVEQEHENTIKTIKHHSTPTKIASKLIAADHISEDKEYYKKLEAAQLKYGGSVQDLSKGTVLEGPSHAKDGIDIVVNNKPVAEAEGGEIVINKISSEKHCEQLSEINQDGGGKKLDCSNAGKSSDDMLEKGVKLKDSAGNEYPPTKIQSILFSTKRYDLGAAQDWLFTRNFPNPRVVDKTENYYRFRQQTSDSFDENSFRTITLTEGVKAVIGHPKMEKGGSVNDGRTYKFPLEMPEEFKQEILSWDYVSKSPHSDSYYNCPGKSWDYTPNGCLRISNHWNFTTTQREKDHLSGEIINNFSLHAPTDIPVNSNKEWALGEYNKDIGIFVVKKKLPISIGVKEKIKEKIINEGVLTSPSRSIYDLKKFTEKEIAEIIVEMFYKSKLSYSKAMEIVGEEYRPNLKKYQSKDVVFIGSTTDLDAKRYLDELNMDLYPQIASKNESFPIFPQYPQLNSYGYNAPDTVLVLDKNSKVIDILYRVKYRGHYQEWFDLKNTEDFYAVIKYGSWVKGGDTEKLNLIESINKSQKVDLMEKGGKVESREKGTITLLKNKEKAPYLGARFGQDVEPTGYYAIEKQTNAFDENPMFETVNVEYEKALIIPVDENSLVSWKYDLSKQKNAKGKSLTNKLLKEGYDIIITEYANGDTGEIIVLDTNKIKPHFKNIGKKNTHIIMQNKNILAKGGKVDNDTGPLYSGAEASKAMKKELTQKFPGIKFSVRYESYSGGDSIRARWNFGPTTAQVDAIIDKYQYGHFDGMTDTYSVLEDRPHFIDAKGNVRELGGVKYVFSDRDTTINDGLTGNEQWQKEISIELLIAKDLVKMQKKEWEGPETTFYDNDREPARTIAYRILKQNAFDTDNVTSYDGLIEIEGGHGNIEDRYLIKYNGNKISVNEKGEKEKASWEKWEKERPEREAKAKEDKERYEAKVAETKKAISEMELKQYQLLPGTNDIIDSLWPSLNKNNTLDQYKKELKEDLEEKKNISHRAKVEQVIIANSNTFNVLANNLMANMPHVWKKVGGTGIEDEDLAKLGITPEEFQTLGTITEAQREDIMPLLYNICTLVYNEETQEAFLVDVQGYDYARYVGFPTSKEEVQRILLNIKIEEDAPLNLNKPTNWSKLPDAWKIVKNLPKIAVDNNPYDKNLQKLLTPFLANNDLRPIFLGAHFDKRGITATDAHKLIHLPYPNKEFDGTYRISAKILIDEKHLKGDKIEGIEFPKYENVIPDGNEVFKINALKLKTFTTAIIANGFTNSSTTQISINGPKNNEDEILAFGFNGKYLIDILNTCLLLGHENLFIGISTPNRAAVFSFNKEAAQNPTKYLGKEVVMLLMPVMLFERELMKNGMISGGVDLDFDKEFKIGYNIPNDQIYNYDGSLATFDFGLTKASDTDLTKEQEKMLNAYLPKKSSLPIIEGALVKDGKLYATDLEATLVLNGIQKPQDVYKYINSALVPYNPSQNESDQWVKLPDMAEYKSIGTVNRLDLLFNIEKCNLCISNDYLRPAMMGVHFLKTKDESELIVESTNANVLFRNEIKNNTINQELNIIVSNTKKLKVFLQNTFDENIEVLISGVNIIFKAESASTIIQLTDEKYPNAVAVIPTEFEKTFTLNIKNLKDCIKSITKEEKQKSAFLAFNNISNKQTVIDLCYWEYPSGKPSQVVKIRQLCIVEASVVEKNKTGKKYAFIGMPIKNETPGVLFSISPSTIDTFLKITESDKLVVDYLSNKTALALSQSEFNQIAEPINIPKPLPKPKKEKDELEKAAEQAKIAHTKEKAAAERNRKLKIAKTKAAAQKQRLRILALKK